MEIEILFMYMQNFHDGTFKNYTKNSIATAILS